MEYRPVPEGRVDDVRALTSYAFSPEDGPYDPEEASDRPYPADRRGLFDGDDLAATCAHYEFTLRVRGRDRPAAGLAAVATPPERRRRGHVRRLLAESLAEYRAEGVPLSVLWPFEYGFYRRFGWATAGRLRRVEVPPEELASAVGDAPETGAFRRLDGDDHGAAVGVLEAMADRYDLTMRYTEPWWRGRTLRGWETNPYVYGWETDGELRAFLRYTVEREDGDRVLAVSDLAFADRAAWGALLRFCRDHDSQVDTVRLRLPPDLDLLDRVDDPRAATHELRPGPMARLVDVADALARFEPARAPSGGTTLALDVTDPLVDRNDRRFAVRLSDDGVAVDPGDAPDAPLVEVDVGTLSQVVVGYRSARAARRLGGLSAPDAAVDALAAAFPPRTGFLAERF